MKRVLTAVLFVLAAQSAFAGLTYKVESVSSGIRAGTMSGVAEVEGKNFRFNVDKGDGMVFPDSSFVISQNGGRTVTVVDATAKTYYQIDVDQISGGMGGVLQQMGGMVKFNIDNPKVNVRDLGPGEKIEGYPTQRKAIDTSYDINIEVMGNKISMGVVMSTESWVTDQISLDFASFLQTGEFHTGFDAVDKLTAALAAQSKAMNGFPLRQVTTVKVSQNGKPMEMKTTTTISGIAKKTFDAAEFTVPAGFQKTDNPIEKMMKGMTGGMKQ
jgi:hypothetical protein